MSFLLIKAVWIGMFPALTHTPNQSLENLVLADLVLILKQSGGDDRAELSNLNA
jgi:hypothetical protein